MEINKENVKNIVFYFNSMVSGKARKITVEFNKTTTRVAKIRLERVTFPTLNHVIVGDTGNLKLVDIKTKREVTYPVLVHSKIGLGTRSDLKGESGRATGKPGDVAFGTKDDDIDTFLVFVVTNNTDPIPLGGREERFI